MSVLWYQGHQQEAPGANDWLGYIDPMDFIPMTGCFFCKLGNGDAKGEVLVLLRQTSNMDDSWMWDAA